MDVKGSTSLVRCLEAEGVKHVFGIPGEENLDLMDSLIDSDIEFVLTRHESGAAFMAGMVGRLTRRPGACLTTLGPGRQHGHRRGRGAPVVRPLVAMSGQVRRDCPAPRKQYIDLVSMFRPITKGSFTARSADQLPALTRRAFDLAAEERPGPVFMELPEDVLKERTTAVPLPPSDRKAAKSPDLGALRSLLASAERPLVLSGAGVLRGGAAKALRSFVSAWNIPAAMTWMGAGAVAFDDRLGLNTVGLRRADMVRAAFEEADLIIMVGFDLIEFEPRYWMVGREKKVAYIGAVPCDLVPGFRPNVEVVGDLRRLLSELSDRPSRKADWASGIRRQLHDSLAALPAEGRGVKPQHIIRAIRDCLGRKDIAVSDVGAHLIWMAQRYPVYEPHTMLVSNGLIPMGVGVPWAIAAKLVHPERKVVASVGDGSFAMTCMELLTAKELGLGMVVVVWNDAQFQLIRARQEAGFNRSTGVKLPNLDFAEMARSMGISGHRVHSVSELTDVMSNALRDEELTRSMWRSTMMQR